MTYIYAVTPADHPVPVDDLVGVGAPAGAVRALPAGGLRVVAGDAPEGLRAKRRDVLAHQQVLERLLDGGPVLPMRFGLVAPDDDQAVAHVTAEEERYTSLLRTLDGCREYNLKGTRDEDDMLRQVLDEVPEARRLNDLTRQQPAAHREKVALGELLAHEVETRRRADTEEVLAALTPLAEQVATAQAVGEEFLNVSFLVRRDNATPFLQAVHEEGERRGDGYAFRLSGPLPPYSFV